MNMEEIMKPQNILILFFVVVIFLLARSQNMEKFTPEDSILGYDYKGCYIEKSSTPSIPNKIGKVSNITECIKKASSLGHNVVGFQSGDICYSGIDPDYSKFGKQSNSKCNPGSLGSGTNVVYAKNTNISATNKEECPKPTVEIKEVIKQEYITIPKVELKEVIKQEYIMVKPECPVQEVQKCPEQKECQVCPEQHECQICPEQQECPVCPENNSEEHASGENMMFYYAIIAFLIFAVVLLFGLYMSTSCPTCTVHNGDTIDKIPNLQI